MSHRPNATHGGGRACYYGHRPVSGTCQPCRQTHARQQTNHNRSVHRRDIQRRYWGTAKGQLAIVRKAAKQRRSV